MFLSVTNIQLKQGPRNFSKKTKIEFYFLLKLKSGLGMEHGASRSSDFCPDPDMRKEPNAAIASERRRKCHSKVLIKIIK